MEQVRIDQWLWAVRLCKTRGAANDACRGGHVRINGRPVKAAAKVRAGDVVEARIGARDRRVEVVLIIDKRVGAQAAAGCFVDHSPAPPERQLLAPAFVRKRGSGRPTKRDRRVLDRHRRS